jgi:hypothetical protein
MCHRSIPVRITSLAVSTISTYYNEQHVAPFRLQQRSETNENDNVLSTTYTLAKGGC